MDQRSENFMAVPVRKTCPDAAGLTIVDLVIFAPPTRCCTPKPPDVFTIRQLEDFAAAMPTVYDAAVSFGLIC